MDYAQARMQARHGARPDEAAWRRLGEQRDFSGYLAAARSGPLAAWLAGIDETAGPHRIERCLRERWRASVAELAGWLPAEWRPAVEFAATLVDLPAAAHLAHGGDAPSWLAHDPGNAAGAAWRDRGEWLAAWQSRWPDDREEEAAALRSLAARVEAHLARFADSDAAPARELRQAFAEEIRRSFRREAGTPAAAFAWLILQALELERLRAELVGRALRRRSLA